MDPDTTDQFTESRLNEICSLIENGIIKIVACSNLSSAMRIFGSRFTDKTKNSTEGLTYKSRLVAANYRDEDEASIAKNANSLSLYPKIRILHCSFHQIFDRTYERDNASIHLIKNNIGKKYLHKATTGHELVFRENKQGCQTVILHTGICTLLVPDL